MNLKQIDYFLATAEKLNFTAAAKSLYVSQPALSKQISLLEEELGVVLLERSNKKVQLTEAGEQFQADLKQVLVEIEAAKERATQIGKGYEKELHIGCFDAAVLDDFLPRFMDAVKNFPVKYETELLSGNFKELRQALKEDRVDMVFTLGFEKAEYYGCDMYSVAKRKGALIYSKKSPLAQKKDLQLTDFDSETLFLMSEKISPSAHQNTLNTLHKINLKVEKMHTVKDMFTLLSYVEMGKGYAILDSAVLNKRSDLLKFDADVDVLEVMAICKQGRKDIAELIEAMNK